MKSNYREALRAEKVAKKMGMYYRCNYALWRRLDHDAVKNARIDRERLNADETIRLFRMMREDVGQFYSHDECGYSSGCGAASIGCACDPYGMVMPCSFLREGGVSVLKAGFRRAWDLLPSRRLPSQKKPRACRECRHAAYCKWCPGVSYLETGNSEERLPYLCKLMDDLHEKKAIGCR
jgi:radical SAM protein with 4Fe4S-binding SPASM domain